MKKNGKFFCENATNARDATRHSSCFEFDMVPKTTAAVNKLTVITEYVADRPDIDDMVPGLCCGFLRLMDELETDFGNLCSNITTGTGKFARKLIEVNVADALDLMCGNYDTLDKCKERKPHILEQVIQRMNQNTPIYNHTAFVSLLTFIERMDSKVNIADGTP